MPREGAPCESSEQCPRDQYCVLGVCSLWDVAIDASERPDAPPDATVDAPPIDAMRPACSTVGLACSGTATMFTCGGNCWVRCTSNVPRETARAACASWTGVLGQIDDATEQACVAMHLSATSWIGLIQASTATTPGGDWSWNGTTAPVYTHWLAGKPDDADGVENRAEQCASIGLDGTWDDQNCGSALDFFCERP